MTNQTPKERLEGAIYKTSIYDVVNDHMEDVRDTTIAYMKWAEGRIGELRDEVSRHDPCHQELYDQAQYIKELEAEIERLKGETMEQHEEVTDAEPFQKALERLINKYSKENGSDTPDYLLSVYLMGCLNNFNNVVKQRDEWHGFVPFASHPKGLKGGE